MQGLRYFIMVSKLGQAVARVECLELRQINTVAPLLGAGRGGIFPQLYGEGRRDRLRSEEQECVTLGHLTQPARYETSDQIFSLCRGRPGPP